MILYNHTVKHCNIPTKPIQIRLKLNLVANHYLIPYSKWKGEKMSKKEKLISKLLQRSKDFTWNELNSLLNSLGYKEVKTGKSGGSRRRFVHDSAATINLHKPHPQNTLKRYTIDQIIEVLKKEDMI